VNSGVTLTVNSGATLNFASGTGITINGKLISNGAVFTSPNETSWKGITLTGAEGSSIQNATISYALAPIIINSTSNITISGCALNHSSFNDGTSYQAAIQINNSSPTIISTDIIGQSNSSNGVRFFNGSSGSFYYCSIENLGYGNGVIIQGGSNPTITDNSITNNLYHGVTVYENGTAVPQIKYNTISHTSKNYVGIYFQSSTGVVQGNHVSGFVYGTWSRYTSSPNSGGLGEKGGNIFTGNTSGIVASNTSTPNFGEAMPNKEEYYGVCNQSYGNDVYNAEAVSSSTIRAMEVWWGQFPPDYTKIYMDGTSNVYDSYPETAVNDCPLTPPLEQISLASINSSSLSSSSQPEDIINQATRIKLAKNYTGAANICRNLLKSTASDKYRIQAIVTLFNIFQSSGDSTIIDDLSRYSTEKGELGIKAKLLLASAYAGVRKLAMAKQLANKLISSYPNSETEKQALFILTGLSGYDTSYSAVSLTALQRLMTDYSPSIDSGLVVALGGFNSNSLARMSKTPNAQAEKEALTEDLNYQLSNYPNPFNPTTVIHYAIPNNGYVSLKVYDALGREVANLVDASKLKGRYDVNFDASKLASGIYFYQLRVTDPQNSKNNFVSTKKMLFVK